MDSTSVALLAREELVREGRSLHALSLIFNNLSNLGFWLASRHVRP
jgi:hypothetical protein